MSKFIKFNEKGTYRYGGYPLPVDENNQAEIPLHLRCSKSILNDMRVRFKLQGEVIGDDPSELGEFDIKVPDTIYPDTEYTIPVTLKSATGSEVKVKINFMITGPGKVTIKMTDSAGTQFEFINEGTWGPETGFDLPEGYEVTTDCLILIDTTGKYTAKFSLVNASSDEVISSNSVDFEVIEHIAEAKLTVKVNGSVESEYSEEGKVGESMTVPASTILSHLNKKYPQDTYTISPEVTDIEVPYGETKEIEFNATVNKANATLNLTISCPSDEKSDKVALTKEVEVTSNATFTADEIKAEVAKLYSDTLYNYPEFSDVTVNPNETKELTIEVSHILATATLTVNVNGKDNFTTSLVSSPGNLGESTTFTAAEIKECYNDDLWYPESKFNVTPEPVDTKVEYGKEVVLEFTAVPKEGFVNESGKVYESIEEAISAGESKLSVNKNLSNLILPEVANLEIDGANHEIAKVQFDSVGNSKVKLSNFKFTGGNMALQGQDQSNPNPGEVTLELENCEFSGYDNKCVYFTNAKRVTINNCKFNCNPIDYIVDFNLCGVKDAEITITNCEFNGINDSEKFKSDIKVTQRGGSDDLAKDISSGTMIWDEGTQAFVSNPEGVVASVTKLTVSGCTFKGGNKVNVCLGSSQNEDGSVRSTTGNFPTDITNAKVYQRYKHTKEEETSNLDSLIVTVTDESFTNA